MMKKLVAGCLLLIGFQTFAQKPEKVYSIIMERREESWYQEQEKLWKAEVDKDRKNANAWYNYYQACRAQYLFAFGSSMQIQLNEKLKKIVEDCYEEIPATFEANLMMYQHFGNHGRPEDYLKYLFKAYEIDPLDSRSYVLLLTHYYEVRDKKKFKEFCEKYYRANEIAGFIYNLGYNILAEVDSNAIVFTAGDNDTYPAFILQEVLGFRRDVKVLNVFLLQLDDFRDKMFEEIGLPKFNKRLEQSETQEELEQAQRELFAHIMDNKQGMPVYVSITGVSLFEENFGEDLYLTGLTYKYSKESIDNTTLIKRNYEHRYKLDALDDPYNFHIQNGKLAEINALYLPAFIHLYIHYRDSENWTGMKELEPRLFQIAREANQLAEIEKLLAK